MMRSRGRRAAGAGLVAAALLVSTVLPHPRPVVARSARQAARASAPVRVFAEPGAGTAPLVAFIGQARHELDGEIYLLSDRAVLAALEQAQARGVHVHLLLEHHPDGGGALPTTAYRTLQSHGITVAWTNPAFTFTHAKYLVEPDAGQALICSCNWTASAFAKNREFGVIDRAPTVVQEAEAVFAADVVRTTVQGSVSALVVSPLNSRPDLLALVARARRTLDVYAEEVDDPQVEQALIAAVKRGVRVRVVCTGDGDVGTLQRGGVQVVVRQTPYIHAKAVVADARAVFIGSENISTTSLDKNRELGLIVTDPAAIATVEQAFTADDQGGSSATPTPAPSGPSTGQRATGSRGVRVTVSPNPTAKGRPTTVAAVTAAGALCRVQVRYASGTVSTSTALRTTETANRAGQVSWSWTFGSKAAGTASATVHCTVGSTTTVGTARFTVE